MPLSPLLALREDVVLEQGKGIADVLRHGEGEISLKGASRALLSALRRLASGGGTIEQLSAEVKESGDRRDLRLLHYYLDVLARRLLICYPLVVDGAHLLTLEAVAARFQFSPFDIERRAQYRLSRFAVARREEDRFVIESPLSLARIAIQEAFVSAMLTELTSAKSCRELCREASGLDEDTARDVMTYLGTAGLIEKVGENGRTADEDDTRLKPWEFHDLLFHSRTRWGRQAYRFGADFRFLGHMDPLPAVKPPMSEDVISLYKPDIELLKQQDPSLTSVLESRKSIRSYGASIGAEELGEFLYRVARVREVIRRDPERGLFYEISRRPYPSGGAAYELEMYLTINTCPPIRPGIYHYNPLAHELCRISCARYQAESLLRDAWSAAGKTVVPQVLITLTSRFQRLSWKYSAIAYATTLKNVGVMFQTMYLAATAMGLAPCALGSGNSDLFTEALGLDQLTESPVGEFMLGTSPRTGPGKIRSGASGAEKPGPLDHDPPLLESPR